MKPKSNKAIRVDGFALSTGGRSTKPPDNSQVMTVRMEKAPNRDVDRGVKKQARQINIIFAVFSFVRMIFAFEWLNDQTCLDCWLLLNQVGGN